MHSDDPIVARTSAPHPTGPRRATRIVLAAFAGAIAVLSGCRGGTSTSPPVHLVLDMDFQPKLLPQSKLEFAGWPDDRAMRQPVSDANGNVLVVARGSLPNPEMPLAHRDANNQFVTENPLPLSHKFNVFGREVSVLERGRDRFEIHCAICHGYSGQGGNNDLAHGLVGTRWTVAIPNFHFVEGAADNNRVPLMPDGEYFEKITYGFGTMPAYGPRISVEDRWAIVHYVRALQSLSR